jgi:hypothetical protein
MPPDEPLLLFSSQNREGRHQLWGRLELLLTPVQRHRDGSLS